jgi:hypothetical protein
LVPIFHSSPIELGFSSLQGLQELSKTVSAKNFFQHKKSVKATFIKVSILEIVIGSETEKKKRKKEKKRNLEHSELQKTTAR